MVDPTQTTSETIRLARALLVETERWCKGAYAYRTDEGEPMVVAPEDDRASSWNVFGALRAVGGPYNSAKFFLTKPEEILNKIAREWGFASVDELNNTSDHAKVLALLDQALVELESE